MFLGCPFDTGQAADCSALTELLLEAEEAVTSAISSHTHHKVRLAAASNGTAASRVAGDHGRHGGGHSCEAAHGAGGDVQMGDDGDGASAGLDTEGYGEHGSGAAAGAGGATRSQAGGAMGAAMVNGGWHTTGSEYIGCQARSSRLTHY